MSGTSLDAIDVALCLRDQHRFVQMAGIAIELDPSLRQQLLTICNDKQVTLQILGEVDHQFALACAEAVTKLLNKENMSADKIPAIGFVTPAKVNSTTVIRRNSQTYNP